MKFFWDQSGGMSGKGGTGANFAIFLGENFRNGVEVALVVKICHLVLLIAFKNPLRGPTVQCLSVNVHLWHCLVFDLVLGFGLQLTES